jgi:23S rRNA (cytidine1920-2'-O)/16S rRNA (cytidine1409-2'-O)-methyltransferase
MTRLDVHLVEKGLVGSRQEAKECIEGASVLVNGEVVFKQSKKINEGDTVEVLSKRKYVSRGGEKLEGAILAYFDTKDSAMVNFRSKKAIDIGSSTGGFTDCLLQLGVEHITAVDVGTLQLHDSLRNNPKVTLYENTDIRSYNDQSLYDIVVADLSFIALSQVFERCLSFAQDGAYIFFLIKPQFEVGKGNTKKGIVKDVSLVEEILASYIKKAEEFGLHEVLCVPSVIQGGDGNQEYFLIGRYSKYRTV